MKYKITKFILSFIILFLQISLSFANENMNLLAVNQLRFSSSSGRIDINDDLDPPPKINYVGLVFYSSVDCSNPINGKITLNSPNGEGYPAINGSQSIKLVDESLYSIIYNNLPNLTDVRAFRISLGDAGDTRHYNAPPGGICNCIPVSCSTNACVISPTIANGGDITSSTTTECSFS